MNALWGLRYMTAQTADTWLVGTVVVLVLFVVSVWYRQRMLSRFLIICVSSVMPLVTLLLLLVPGAYKGVPDTHCDKYKEGKQVFVLEGATVRPAVPSDPYGDAVLALLVRAHERWGDELHLCVIPRDSEKGKSVLSQISSGFRPGITTFVFGNEWETPNVLGLSDQRTFKKPGPPESPRTNGQ